MSTPTELFLLVLLFAVAGACGVQRQALRRHLSQQEIAR